MTPGPLTQSIGQTLFFHFDEMKQYHGDSGRMDAVWNLMHEPLEYIIPQLVKKKLLAHIIYSGISKHNRLGTNYFGMFKAETKRICDPFYSIQQ